MVGRLLHLIRQGSSSWRVEVEHIPDYIDNIHHDPPVGGTSTWSEEFFEPCTGDDVIPTWEV